MMKGYALINDPVGTYTTRIKPLLPDTSDPDRLTDEQLADRGIGRYERVYEPVEWWQTRGEPVVSAGVITYPAVDLPLDEAKERAKRRVNQRRDELQVEPLECNGHVFQTRPVDRENLLGGAMDAFMWITGGGDPDSYYWDADDPGQPQGWIAVGNQTVPMTAAQMIEFSRVVKARHKTLIFQAREKKDAVENAGSVADVVEAAGWE
jgi:hypothetical protein